MTAGRYIPRNSNLTDSTAFSFSPIIFAYFIPALTWWENALVGERQPWSQ